MLTADKSVAKKDSLRRGRGWIFKKEDNDCYERDVLKCFTLNSFSRKKENRLDCDRDSLDPKFPDLYDIGDRRAYFRINWFV